MMDTKESRERIQAGVDHVLEQLKLTPPKKRYNWRQRTSAALACIFCWLLLTAGCLWAARLVWNLAVSLWNAAAP